MMDGTCYNEVQKEPETIKEKLLVIDKTLKEMDGLSKRILAGIQGNVTNDGGCDADKSKADCMMELVNSVGRTAASVQETLERIDKELF